MKLPKVIKKNPESLLFLVFVVAVFGGAALLAVFVGPPPSETNHQLTRIADALEKECSCEQ